MRIGSGEHTYDWIDGWAKIPDSDAVRATHSHHGVVVTEAGDIMLFHQAEPSVLALDQEGNIRRSLMGKRFGRRPRDGAGQGR